MTYDEVYNLRQSGGWVRNRTIVAVGNYAAYLAGQGGNATADQKAFVARVLPGANAEIEADFILWSVLFNATIQASGEAVTDGQVDSIVQTVLASLGRVQAV